MSEDALRRELAELRAVLARLVELRRGEPGSDEAELAEISKLIRGEAAGDPIAGLTVERLEVVDPDGTVRVRLLNGVEPPPAASDATEPPRAGIVFYDAHGREAGALTYSGSAGDGTRRAVHELVFRAPGAASATRLVYREEDGRTIAGVEIDGASGAFLGKDGDTSLLVLRDAEARDRLRLIVGPAAAPRLEFLDESGVVTRTLE